MLFVVLNCSIVVLGHRQLSCFIEKQKILKKKKVQNLVNSHSIKISVMLFCVIVYL